MPIPYQMEGKPKCVKKDACHLKWDPYTDKIGTEVQTTLLSKDSKLKGEIKHAEYLLKVKALLMTFIRLMIMSSLA